jgi:hypothetical protein
VRSGQGTSGVLRAFAAIHVGRDTLLDPGIQGGDCVERICRARQRNVHARDQEQTTEGCGIGVFRIECFLITDGVERRDTVPWVKMILAACVSITQHPAEVFAATQPIQGKAIPTNGGTIGFAA